MKQEELIVKLAKLLVKGASAALQRHFAAHPADEFNLQPHEWAEKYPKIVLHTQDFLSGIGTLILSGTESRSAPMPSDFENIALAALADVAAPLAMELEGLKGALRAADNISSPERASLAEQIASVLARRDEVEVFLVGLESAWSGFKSGAIEYLDRELGAILASTPIPEDLIPTFQVKWVTPSLRDRFWWYATKN